MTEQTVVYYAAIASDTATAEDPSGVFRTLDAAGLDAESFGQDGTWHANDWFIERRNRGTEVGTVEPITPGQAAVIIHRWRDTGIVPKVEGVDIPPLPETDESAPLPGSGPVDAAAAQAVADEWMNAGRRREEWTRAGVYEFDLGYLVYQSVPKHTDTSRPPANVGAGRGIIDKATGELTMWPSLPIEVVVDMYRRKKADEQATDQQATDRQDTDGQADPHE